MSIEETDAIFARAYASAITKKFIPGGINKNTQVVFLSPLVQRGIAGGDLIPEPVTNYMVYKAADNLLGADDPSYIGGGQASYIQSLRSYADYIDTKTNRSPAVVTRMVKARDAVDITEKKFEEEEDKAWARYEKAKDHFPGVSFNDWASESAPGFNSAKERRNAAYNELDSAAQLFDGPQASALYAIRNKIRNAQERTTVYSGLNQIAVSGDIDLLNEALIAANGGKKLEAGKLESFRVPAYSVQGYLITLKEWIRRGGQAEPVRTESLKIDVSSGFSSKWEDFGYKKVEGRGSIGIFPFFHVTVKTSSEEKSYKLDTAGKETEISLELKAIGFQLVQVEAGEWDVRGIKTMFPDLLPDAPKVLTSDLARVSSILFGYDVALTVTFGSKLRTEAKDLYEKARSSGGSLTIFGFHVAGSGGGGSSEQVKTDFEHVNWDNATGSITLTPAPQQVYPTLLAVLGQRL
ncbi:hypothetical protein CPB84DRAFT_1855772 [Gymnopilus junonius]|uniref:Uncharacterized protein n=1 Tax=Gymnopilus junonius TaxID=109634 RepID=A0A9P5N6U4_GYMJU|nr:hypothetical protein CPB84DRAFT_1855772 [Gymnopilus junonius]